MRYGIVITVAAALLASISSTFASDRFAVKVGSYGPRTEVRLARPTLKWEIWPATEKSKVRHIDFRLDGKPVDAKYEEKLRAVVYTPTAPLSAGSHKVECRITFENGASFNQSWETRISATPLDSLPATSPAQNEAFDLVNRYRTDLGLPPVVHDPRLSHAALLHSTYLGLNDATGHGERPGTPGYLAQSGAERLEAFGWIGSSWEGVNFGTDSIAESIQGLFDAPYHRLPFMQPGEIAFGSGFADKRCTVEFGASEDAAVVVSPADGQKDVPCTWRNFEKPNPLRVHKSDARVTGYPIVLANFAVDFPPLGAITGTLTDANGRAVPCWFNSPANDDQLKNGCILIPQSPLRPGTTYRYSFKGVDAKGTPISAGGSFTTGK